MDDFLPKPLRSDALATALRRWIGEHDSLLDDPLMAAIPPIDLPPLPALVPAAPRPAAARSRPAIDRAAVERLNAVHADVVGELIDVFVAQAPEQLAAIRDAARSGQPGLLRLTAHTLKGDAAAWGAGDLVRCCAEIERHSDGSPADYDMLLSALERELARVTDALRGLGAPTKSVA